MKLNFPLRLLAVASLAAASFLAQAADLTVAYQTTVDPAKVAQSDGAYEKATKTDIAWRKFDNGADIIAAIASGDVQIGYLGSSPLTAAITRKVPVETFLIATQIGAAEALVARDGSGIKTPQDLIGKKIAVPFVSTGHYSLLAALKHWNIDPSKVTVLNLAPPAIIAAWKRGDIDATYVWDPALGVAKENGKVLITSGELAKSARRPLMRGSCAKTSPRSTRKSSPRSPRSPSTPTPTTAKTRKPGSPISQRRQAGETLRCQGQRYSVAAARQRLPAGGGSSRHPRRADHQSHHRYRRVPQGTRQGRSRSAGLRAVRQRQIHHQLIGS
jgi:ABC-type amino acid transport substrate-binding protein